MSKSMICGFCRAGLHGRCPVAVFSPGSKPAKGEITGLIFSCECTAAGHPSAPACRDCGRRDVVLGPSLHCLDGADCELYVQQLLADSPLATMLQACRADARDSRREAREASTARVPSSSIDEPRVQRPTTGSCLCCSQPTRGGLFLPGHDSRLLGQLQRQVDAGELDREQATSVLTSAGCSGALVAKLRKRLGVPA